MINKTIIQKTIFAILISIFLHNPGNSQHTIFSENFEEDSLGPSWNIVNGKWHIADVSERRIAPAENGYRHALCTSGEGYIRLIVDLPDSILKKPIQLQFAYYTYSKGPGATLEVEFHKRGQMDGIKGKRSLTNLPIKGRWVVFQKTFRIPPGANAIYIVYFETPSKLKNSKGICFDAMSIKALR